jgi:hypothetical protein
MRPWGIIMERRLVLWSRPPAPALQTTLACPPLTSGPVRRATASQVTPPHAQASGASAMAQIARAMPQRRPRAAL